MSVALNSTYAQYPVLKKIGNDSVVIITLKQGEQINQVFDRDQKKILNLKDSIAVLKERQSFYEKLSLRRIKYEDSLKYIADTTALKYRVSKEIYENEEKNYRKYLRNTSIYAAVITLFIMIISSSSGK